MSRLEFGILCDWKLRKGSNQKKHVTKTISDEKLFVFNQCNGLEENETQSGVHWEPRGSGVPELQPGMQVSEGVVIQKCTHTSLILFTMSQAYREVAFPILESSVLKFQKVSGHFHWAFYPRFPFQLQQEKRGTEPEPDRITALVAS